MMLISTPSLEAVKTLVEAADLPTDDLSEPLDHFLACGDPARPDGVVGLEVYGPDALLRSLVVRETIRGRGLGKELVAAAEARAEHYGVSRIFLLTETAEEFFAALGYTSADRQSAPETIRTSQQFSQLCPASAAFMVKELGHDSAVRD